MGLFKTKHIIDLDLDRDLPIDMPPVAWPEDTIDEVDDLAFAKAIAAGRAAEADANLTVAA